MAVIITVHGTWARVQGDASPDASAVEQPWWSADSRFAEELKHLVAGGTGPVRFESFTWSGDNSEIARRDAGRALATRLRALEAERETYCLVGHSHGGSVISTALLACAAKRQNLPGLKRWITVGTPFVTLKREPLLMQRVDLASKIVLVASTMLFFMFLVYALAEWWSTDELIFGSMFQNVLVVTGVMTSLPAIVFYLVLKLRDSYNLMHHRRATRDRAAQYFASRWRSLTHVDDEAVQGLSFLPRTKLHFFDKTFAVKSVTLLSVLVLPLLYLLIVSTPSLMVATAGWLKTNLYESRADPQVERSLREMRQRLRPTRDRPRVRTLDRDLTAEEIAERRARWREYREMRRNLEARHGDVRSTERAIRFRGRFFERDGQPCPGDVLCGMGRDLRINSALLLHLATDELSWAVGAENIDAGWGRSLATLLLPAVLVPLLSVLLAFGVMVFIRSVAYLLSDGLSRILNAVTSAEVKRAAYGNDTESEIAVGASDHPSWLDRSPPRLPQKLADVITDHSDIEATRSISKFRRAIGHLTSADRSSASDSAIATYFTWKELVHSAYFDVPAFRKMVARTLAAAEGFAPTPAFQADPDFATTTAWLSHVEGAAVRTEPGEEPPTAKDVGAVSATIASTVKVDP